MQHYISSASETIEINNQFQSSTEWPCKIIYELVTSVTETTASSKLSPILKIGS